MSISEQRSFSQTSVVSQPRQQPERARSPLPLPTGSQPPQSPALHSFLYYNSSLQENQSLDHAASELVNTNGDPERPSLVGQRNFAGGNAMNLNTTTAASSSKPSSRSTSRPNSRPPSRSETTTSKRREFQQAANAGRSSTAANGTAHARVGKRPHPVAGVKFHGDDDAAADMSGEELLALRSSTAPSAWLPESGGAAGVGAFAPQHQFGSGMKRSANAASAPHSRARAMRSRGAGAGGGRQLNASARSASLNGTLSGTTQTQQLEFDDLDGTTFTTDNEQEVGSLSAGAGGTTRTNGSLLKKAFEQGINLYARPPVLAPEMKRASTPGVEIAWNHACTKIHYKPRPVSRSKSASMSAGAGSRAGSVPPDSRPAWTFRFKQLHGGSPAAAALSKGNKPGFMMKHSESLPGKLLGPESVSLASGKTLFPQTPPPLAGSFKKELYVPWYLRGGGNGMRSGKRINVIPTRGTTRTSQEILGDTPIWRI
mmetsp:Transcript_22635/g.57337  ORF Transcript_22635/g.57337 Transcript_22635/m.57337 type:complete len:485 (+) Transcript_22635:319-1773(+)